MSKTAAPDAIRVRISERVSSSANARFGPSSVEAEEAEATTGAGVMLRGRWEHGVRHKRAKGKIT